MKKAMKKVQKKQLHSAGSEKFRLLGKIIVLTLTALLTISLSACSQGNKTKEDKKMNKVLVAYFSASGVTEGVVSPRLGSAPARAICSCSSPGIRRSRSSSAPS